MEWVEAIGPDVDTAVAEAVAALGITIEQAEVEILQEPKKGLLGRIGGQDAIVKVSEKPKPSGRRRRRRSKGKGQQSHDQQKQGGPKRNQDSRPEAKKKATGQKNRPNKQSGRRNREESAVSAPDVSIEDQAGMAKEFIEGLLEAFGLEGDVNTRVEDEILFIDVNGDQTEALVGQKGAILQAIHELTRTVIQRKTFRAPRMRLDIAGYTERRRAALKIFAAQVAEKVIDGAGEIMLEPMNPADRKVLHDAVAEIDGVRSFSEGEDPNRSVVIAPVDE
jgi:spoIIIJ-associated protein